MIKRLKIKQYRKLKDIEFVFSPNLNVISGTNGTCKTSLLHIASNSFQAVTKSCSWVEDKKCLAAITAINDVTNPKVESLTRGDQKYNDPANGVSGSLFTVEYYGHTPLEFRRHNSSQTTRYAIKPWYQRGSGDKLPHCPIIYLGLSRLMPFGEFKNDDALCGINKKLPEKYQQFLTELYKRFTGYTIANTKVQQMGDIKTRAEFSSDKDGIDSNTISAGEDNLYILLVALMSLRYYYDSIISEKDVESILLIDEIDATLHPEFQIKLLRLLREYSEAYKIQVIFTSHSMSTLEDMLAYKDNVIYLVDNVTNVVLMDEPDIYKIRMHLSSLTQEDIYLDKVIPVYTEDKEARFIVERLLSYLEDKKEEFRGIKRFFYFPDINLGAGSLMDMFKDPKLLRTSIRAICILDGDHNTDLSNNIVALPGSNDTNAGSGLSPERLMFDYAERLIESDDSFWTERYIIDKGYGKPFYITHIKNDLERFEENYNSGDHSKKPREYHKELFNKYINFFDLLFKHWLNNADNQREIYRFYTDLYKLFKKNAQYNGINPKEWVINEGGH
ncbi:AAA family ATPase [Hornefia butyriciproducens]|uniref:AAA family ATPase n=1 Tax=Hornefia butyriciproducens TaxID=2652293 RepID=UPI002A9182A7|nr:AAA family ATPase [Hornefia butyriciproducens]MDY5463312.1 AAA family ATPase [Hornefia butyriciproducens]